MTTEQMQRCFERLCGQYFVKANIRWGYTSLPKPVCPFLLLTLSGVHRDIFPTDDGEGKIFLLSATVTADLYTPGRKFPTQPGRTPRPSFNTAVSDMQSFLDYLLSEEGLCYQEEHDLSVLPQGDTVDVSALLNDSVYEYRARQLFTVNFAEETRGYAGITPPDKEEFEETPSGGGTQEQADSQIGWFNKVEVAEKNE